MSGATRTRPDAPAAPQGAGLSAHLVGALGMTGALLLQAGTGAAQTPPASPAAAQAAPPETASHPYVGMWVTADGRIRHALLPNGRYDEARGHRESAYRGRYVVDGNAIDYVDDTGFTADGVFVDENTLHHGGMVLFRRSP
uniref:Atu4866 domain-containing protein n=1 Tax=Luteimonas sp. 4-12 TaxID=2027406 RepID=UPI001E3CEE31|nr:MULTISPECIES: Atu4866 domain-containing protein [Luteimonas]